MKRLEKAVLGNEPNADYAAAIHLGRQHYFILGTIRRPKDSEIPEPHGWRGRKRWEILRMLGEKAPSIRKTQLVLFFIESAKQKKLLRQFCGTVVKAGLEGEPEKHGRIAGVIPNFIQYCQTGLPKNLDADQLWFVDCECRPNVIAISANGDGFFLPGQEPCWGFSHVETWHRLVHDRKAPEAEYFAIIGKFTGKQIGVCTAEGKEQALKQSDTGKLIPISKKKFDAFH